MPGKVIANDDGSGNAGWLRVRLVVEDVKADLPEESVDIYV